MDRNNRGLLLDIVKIRREALLSALKKNLEKHKADVAEATKLRHENAMIFFTDQIEAMAIDCNHKLDTVIRFPNPVDSSEDYLRAIRMVEMTEDMIIELDENQFDRLVMDNWSWKKVLIDTSAVYGKIM